MDALGTYLNYSNNVSKESIKWFDGQSLGLGCIGLAPNLSMNFSEAVSFCDSVGMRFVTIYGENQNNFIKELVTNNPPDSTFFANMGYWIGLERVEDTYQGTWNGTNTVPSNTWKWNADKSNCDVVAKFTSWPDYFGNYGDDNIEVVDENYNFQGVNQTALARHLLSPPSPSGQQVHSSNPFHHE